MKPLVASAVLLLLVGCDKPPAADPTTAARNAEAIGVAAPTLPLGFARKTPDAEVALTLDARIGAWPALHQRLYNEGKRELTSFLASAQADRAKLAGEDPPPPYQRSAEWTVAAETGRLVSLRQNWTEYTGGAHPNHGSATLLWSKGGEAPVLQPFLFRADADYGALDAALCAAAKGAKAARLGAAAAEGGGWACPKWKDSRAVLAPSTVQGKAGGLTFLFDPYVLGPYAEGDYEATAPQAQFRAALKPEFANEFDGAPEPTGKAR